MVSRDLQQRAHFERVASETFRRESLILETDRDPMDVVMRRTEALLTDIRRMAQAPDLAGAAAALADLRATADQIAVTNAPARRELFDKTCRLRRQIAFANPLLNFDSLLFLTRHRGVLRSRLFERNGL